jgi:pimeloyl-ACP methyl ester carboxylesterase
MGIDLTFEDILMKLVYSVLALSLNLTLATSRDAFALASNAGQNRIQEAPSETSKPVLQNAILIGTLDAATLSKSIAGFGVKARNGISIYRISYATEGLNATELVASGLVLIPDTQAPVYPWVSLQHGTVTSKVEAPSAAPREGLLEASQGFVTVVPDYIGYGDSSNLPHPYIIEESYQKPLVDMLRAARELSQQKNFALGPLFLKGYSEGGYATLALQKAIETEYADEFAIVASAPAAGPYNVELTGLLSLKKSQVSPVNLPFVVLSYNTWLAGRQLPLKDIFVPSVETVENALSGSFSAGEVYGLLPSKATDLLQSTFIADFLKPRPEVASTREFRRLLRSQSLLTGWIPKAPTRFFHCQDDDQIPVAVTEQTVATFKAKGAQSISSVIIQSPSAEAPYLHGNCPAIVTPVQWFGEILAGVAAQ